MRDERRRWPRHVYSNGHLPPTTRLRPGAIVTLVNLSCGGALVESTLRLRWGTRCDLEWTMGDGMTIVAARVTRCYVARLGPSGVRYRTAVRFETTVASPAAADLLEEYQLPGTGTWTQAERVVASPRSPGSVSSGTIPRQGTRSETKVKWHRP